ncbi:hypothetical protein DdX_13060 [Ditylenchus destructor]|uniref:Uncharacterized protein n=1 Tax=Ditylenchus destructor TaxID=166010 RepID=A0AAD4MWR5_9BILA|nr:hypothetical protein DdX_13060 [Ditylenchus destructor]
MPGGKTRGESGVPEAVIDTPSGIENMYWPKDDRYSAAPPPWYKKWQTDNIRFGYYALRPNPLRPNPDFPNWRQSWHGDRPSPKMSSNS